MCWYGKYTGIVLLIVVFDNSAVSSLWLNSSHSVTPAVQFLWSVVSCDVWLFHNNSVLLAFRRTR